jgi:hypothetical protein
MPRPGHTGMVFVAETELYVAETESLFVAKTETETELFVAEVGL